MSNTTGFRFLNAMVVVSFSAATEAALEVLVNTWIQNNAGSRSLVQLTFLVVPLPSAASTFSAYLVYTE